MNGGPMMVANRGASGRLSVFVVALLAIALAVGAVVWPRLDDEPAEAARKIAGEGRTSTTTTTTPPTVRIDPVPAWKDDRGFDRLSNDSLCEMVPLRQLRKVTHNPATFDDPERVNGHKKWGGQCWYYGEAEGKSLTSRIEFSTHKDGSLDSAVTSESKLSDDVEQCDEEMSGADNTQCARIVRLPFIGEGAVATEVYIGRAWAVDQLLFDQGPFRVLVVLDRSLPDQRELSITVARLIAAKLPVGAGAVHTIPRPAECAGNAASC